MRVSDVRVDNGMLPQLCAFKGRKGDGDIKCFNSAKPVVFLVSTKFCRF